EAIKPADFPHVFTVFWRYKASNESGASAQEISDAQMTLEELIDPAFAAAGIGHLMLVVTGRDIKDWYWYVWDTAEAMAVLNKSLAGHPRFPIEIEWQKDPEWKAYWGFRNKVSKRPPASP